ncbi:MAG: response regulator [Pseudolabrys sp.]
MLDWEIPLLTGPEFVCIVRSPGVFPLPDLPIIMLTAHGERWRVVEVVRLGVNEFLCKPVSAKALLDRIISILAKPRASVQVGDYYGPEPRKLMMPLDVGAGVGDAPDLGDLPEVPAA